MKRILNVIGIFLLFTSINFAQTTPKVDNGDSLRAATAADSVAKAAENAVDMAPAEEPASPAEKGMDLTSGLIGLLIGAAAGYFLGSKMGNKSNS